MVSIASAMACVITKIVNILDLLLVRIHITKLCNIFIHHSVSVQIFHFVNIYISFSNSHNKYTTFYSSLIYYSLLDNEHRLIEHNLLPINI